MPYITIKMVEGRDLEVKRRLVAEVTKVVSETLHITSDNVRIEIVELQADLFSISGELVYDTRNKNAGGG